MDKQTHKSAKLYRMVMDEHICPFGIKSKHLLEKHGYEVEDHHLTTREETDAFQEKHNVDTTPQTFIDGERVGGLDELHAYLEEPSMKQEGTTYQPVIAVFATSFLMALAVGFTADSLSPIRIVELFIAISMCVLAILKLRDLFSFTNQFITYDLLAGRYVPYGYFYPFAEAGAGILMIASALIWLAAPVALLIGTIGAISVFKAVYIDKRELKCACVGGDSNVPLGAISLTENLMMVGMAIWMGSKLFV
ncbi:glutaredoxin [Maritalea mediterranea]|uniref:Methylamine utilization protein MauE n=1 Tax=Maritalea mediterranea TaxID=2909667 RepID=A0ABS9E327_9HYPH|nr:glutaredoxin [Maritalea mediterranea]MCF4097217.1 glutaredoxin [Maritalea mediterranea]